jgi:hypothetical protein
MGISEINILSHVEGEGCVKMVSLLQSSSQLFKYTMAESYDLLQRIS